MKGTPDCDPMNRVEIRREVHQSREKKQSWRRRTNQKRRAVDGMRSGKQVSDHDQRKRRAKLPKQRQSFALREFQKLQRRREQQFQRVATAIFDEPRRHLRCDPYFEKQMQKPKRKQRERPFLRHLMRFPSHKTPYSRDQPHEYPRVTLLE